MNRQHSPYRDTRSREDDERRMGLGGPTTPRSRDYDRRSHATQFGEGEIGDDRYPHGHPSRGRQYGEWDEDRYGYPEATSYGREMQRSRDAYRPEGRFAQQSEYYGRDRDTRSDLFRHGGQAGRPGGGYGEGGYGIPAEHERNDGSRQDSAGYGRYPGSDWARFGGQGVSGNRPTGQYGRQTPKGYTRSDERIKDDVCEHLYHADDIDLGEVTVECENGTVKLEGMVPERRMKHRIEDIAEQCIGVLDVENRIRVSRAADRGMSPLATAAAENPGESRNDHPRRSGEAASGSPSPRH